MTIAVRNNVGLFDLWIASLIGLIVSQIVSKKCQIQHF